MPADGPLVVEDDRFLRVVGVVLDPNTSPERTAAYADFFAHDEPDFDGYCTRVRARVGKLFPREVRLVETQAAMRAALPGSPALVVESLRVGDEELAAGSELRVVQKYGLSPRNIDTAACAAKGIKVLTIRRRANIACAELAIALMLTLAKKLHRLAGRISVEQLREIGYAYKPFDRRHTPNSNWPRISGLRVLNVLSTFANFAGRGFGQEASTVLGCVFGLVGIFELVLFIMFWVKIANYSNQLAMAPDQREDWLSRFEEDEFDRGEHGGREPPPGSLPPPSDQIKEGDQGQYQ